MNIKNLPPRTIAAAAIVTTLVAVPGALIGASSMDDNGFYVFNSGERILSAEVNENFAVTSDHIGLYEDAISVDDNGRVGIGVEAPGDALDVDGNAKMSGLKARNTTFTVYGNHSIYGQVQRMLFTDNELRVGDWLNNSDGGESVVTIEGAENASGGSARIGTLAFSNDSNRAGQDNGHIAAITAWSRNAEGLNNGELRFQTKDGTTLREHMVITLDGDVGIGINTPQQQLHVAGNVTADEYLTNSDARLKTDVADIEDASEAIDCLQGVTYQRLDDPGQVELGFIAQEVERCFPTAVTTDGLGYKSVSYARLVAPLVEAVKAEQAHRKAQGRAIEALTARLNALEGRQ